MPFKHKHPTETGRRMVRRISLFSFAFGFADAFLLYLFSSYFSEASGSENVSLFYLIPFGVIFVTLFYFHALVARFGKIVLLTFFLVALVAGAFALVIIPVSLAGAGVLMAMLVVINLVWVNMDLILESYSEDHSSGRTRGLYLTIIHIGFITAPFSAFWLLDRYGYGSVFFTSILIYGTVLVFALLAFSRMNSFVDGRLRPRQILAKVLPRSDIMRDYWISLSLEFAYAVMIVYVPIRMVELGFGWEDLGLAFSWMLLPFLLLPYPLGVLADRRMGEKEGIVLSLTWIAGMSLLIASSDSTNLFTWILLLIGSRVGFATLEVLRDSYFYKRIDGDDADVIAFFRTTRPVANLLAAAATGLCLLFAPLPAVFLLMGGVVLLALVPALRLEDNHAESERK